MHYYKFNIGNYRRRTLHLSPLEHGVYRILLDTYYLEERPLELNVAKLMRTHCLSTKDEKLALKNVLADFFKKTENGWENESCDVEIKKYHSKSVKARASANVRWDAVASKSHNGRNANKEPLTNNHKQKRSAVLPAWEKQGFKTEKEMNDHNRKEQMIKLGVKDEK